MKKIFPFIKRALLAFAATACIAAAIAQVQQLPTVKVAGHVFRYYDVQRGDNLYTVAEKLGIDIDNITTNNPSSADGLTPGMRLYFPADLQATVIPEKEIPKASDPQKPLTHLVEKGESIYGLAEIYDIPVDKLVRLNPQAVTGLTPGMVLILDDSATLAETNDAIARTKAEAEVENAKIEAEVAQAEAESAAAQTPQQPQADRTISLADLVKITNDSIGQATAQEQLPADTMTVADAMSVAVILPFMSDEKKPSRAAMLDREFLRGMLLAARDEAGRPGPKVFIRAYDTHDNSDSLSRLMDMPEVNGADIKIVPDAESQIALIERSDSYGLVLNYFSIKDESYLSNPDVIQANIPHDDMYRLAINGFLDKYRSGDKFYTPVFLTRINGRNDKQEFTTELRKRLDTEGISYRTIEFTDRLTEQDLADIDTSVESAVFIPESGNRTEFTKIAPALTQLAESAPSAVAVFGYPEWVTFRGDNLKSLGDMNATIYSRFFFDDNDYDVRDLRGRYSSTFRSQMAESYPERGVMGYDAGKYVIKALRAMASGEQLPTDFEGYQSTLHLEKATDSPQSGWVNRSLYLIDYLPAGVISKTRL